MDLFVNFDSARFAVNAFNQAVMIIMLYDDDMILIVLSC